LLLRQAGLKSDQAEGGAVTLIQCFGSAANLTHHLLCLVPDGAYRRGETWPVFRLHAKSQCMPHARRRQGQHTQMAENALDQADLSGLRRQRQLSGTVDADRQLTGIFNRDDGCRLRAISQSSDPGFRDLSCRTGQGL